MIKKRHAFVFTATSFGTKLCACSFLKYFGQVLVGFLQDWNKRINQLLAEAIFRFIESFQRYYGTFFAKADDNRCKELTILHKNLIEDI